MQRLAQTWRTYLGQLIELPGEKQRAARALGVNPLTLTRWVEGKTEPRPGSLRRLPGVFPTHERRLAELIREAYDPSGAGGAVPGELFRSFVPPEFTARILSCLAMTAGHIVTSSICNLVLRQAIAQLDYELLGMEITITQCTPPRVGEPVLSVCERIGVGTTPWPQGVGKRLLFLGSESLAGYVVGRGEPGVIQDVEQEHGLLPVRPGEHEKSAAAYPILRRGRVAGCFLASSTQKDFFIGERISLLEQYANLVALAFSDNQFYRPKEIALVPMPVSAVQQQYAVTFRQRVLALKKCEPHRLSEQEAETSVLQEIESILLKEAIEV